MNTEGKPSGWQNQDATLWLLLAALASCLLCVLVCIVFSASGDFINNTLAPGIGLVAPTPTPAPCPAVPAGWDTVLNDDFKFNKDFWPVGKETGEYADTNLTVYNGLLRLEVMAKQGTFQYFYPAQQPASDFYFVSRARRVSGPADAEYGIVFRLVSDQKLFFAIRDSGTVTVHARTANGIWADPLLRGRSGNIKVREPNDLVVLAQGSHYTFCVNDHVVGEIENTMYLPGKFGIGVDLHKAHEQATFEYDDFTIYAPAK